MKYKLIDSLKLAAFTLELHSFAHCVIEDKGDKMMASYWKRFSGIILQSLFMSLDVTGNS